MFGGLGWRLPAEEGFVGEAVDPAVQLGVLLARVMATGLVVAHHPAQALYGRQLGPGAFISGLEQMTRQLPLAPEPLPPFGK
ncbi:hypothetical protein D5H75_36130 [Bailinhaonella thermotolerans]|uniref:Uncharacterized protein n=1 Tax=Bailinhaonella thermotolerans TaxID=1070861 RepID=A0A3A4A809_9ACTN|nr:hypothetical protein D5H75_36130 [Bailinhaonella thermotolerans]